MFQSEDRYLQAEKVKFQLFGLYDFFLGFYWVGAVLYRSWATSHNNGRLGCIWFRWSRSWSICLTCEIVPAVINALISIRPPCFDFLWGFVLPTGSRGIDILRRTLSDGTYSEYYQIRPTPLLWFRSLGADIHPWFMSSVHDLDYVGWVGPAWHGSYVRVCRLGSARCASYTTSQKRKINVRFRWSIDR